MQAVSKIEQMPSQFTQDQIQVLKNTMCKGISDNDFMIFSHICKRTGLDPFAKQIYAVARGGKMTIQTGIDGFRLIAERTGKYAPGREPVYAYNAEGKLLSATAYIKKQTQDSTWHEVSATAFFSEYVQIFNGVPSQFWAKMPHGQLAKCAEALALRKAFPQDMSGLYSTEEMDQASNSDNLPQADSEDVTPKKIVKTPLIKMVSCTQIEQLENALIGCSDEFLNRLTDIIKERKLDTYDQMSEKFFLNVMKGISDDKKALRTAEVAQ